jgi:hypothetical protein
VARSSRVKPDDYAPAAELEPERFRLAGLKTERMASTAGSGASGRRRWRRPAVAQTAAELQGGGRRAQHAGQRHRGSDPPAV